MPLRAMLRFLPLWSYPIIYDGIFTQVWCPLGGSCLSLLHSHSCAAVPLVPHF
jgi:hypothetical protein